MRKSRDSRRCGDLAPASRSALHGNQAGLGWSAPFRCVLKPVRDGSAFIHPLAEKEWGSLSFYSLLMQRASEATPSSCLWEMRSNTRSDPGGPHDGHLDVDVTGPELSLFLSLE